MDIKRTAVFAFIFVAFYNLFLYNTRPGVGTGVLFLSLNLFFFAIRVKDGKNFPLAIESSFISVLFAFLFAFRSNIIVQTLNLGVAVFFSLAALYFYKYSEKFSLETLKFLLLPLVSIVNSISGFINLLKPASWTLEKSTKELAGSLLKGVTLTIPIFIVLSLLLIAADPVFEKIAQDFLENSGERVFASALIFVILMGFGLAKFLQKLSSFQGLIKVSIGKAHELAIITGSIIALFACFIAIQFRYLFSSIGERDLAELGIKSLTYSEYVRKGFFELLIASAIAALVIGYVFRYLHQLRNRQKTLIQFFSIILTVQTGLLLLSAIKRLFLYADAHGLTRARVFGFVFLLWLLALLVIFLFRIFTDLTKEKLFVSTISIILIAFLAVNIFNIDGLIATKYRPTVNDEVDYYYVTSLSADGFESWSKAIEESAKIITSLEAIKDISPENNRRLYWVNLTLEQLRSHFEYLNNKYGKNKNFSWQSYNLSEHLAFKSLVKNPTFSNQISTLLDKALILNARVSEDVRFNTPLDRSTTPPLTP